MKQSFKLRRPITGKMIRNVCGILSTMNATKIGKHRRGQLLLESVHGQDDFIEFKWRERSVSSRFQLPRFLNSDGQVKKIELYRYADHKTCLRKIGKLKA